MDNETKKALLKWTNSYWDMLPPELQHMILMYKESQELIEWREHLYRRRLCCDIVTHGQLRAHWFIGPIHCKPGVPKGCKCESPCFFHKIYGHYWDLNGERKQVLLSYGFYTALAECDYIKNSLDYQTNPEHSLSVSALKLFS